jgi:putative transposase
MPASIPIELRERIVRAHVERGMGLREIAELFAVGYSSVWRYISKHENGEDLEPGVAPGAQPKLTASQRSWLKKEIEDDPYLTSHELSARYNRRFRSNRVHRSTILRAMRALGFTHKKKRR